MSEYIKRKDAISQLEPLWDRMHEEGGLIDPDCELGINESIEVIKAIPSADVAEVRHGHWGKMFNGKFTGGAYWYSCSNCGRIVPDVRSGGWNYCPNCGAKMDGGGDDE